MTHTVEQYCQKIIAKHCRLRLDDFEENNEDVIDAIKHSILEVEGIIEALEDAKNIIAKAPGGWYHNMLSDKINFYKQALEKLKS